MLKIYRQVRKSAALIKGSETVNFCLNAVNFRLVRQGEQGNNEKKFQGCISKGEERASVDLPVMFFRANCNVEIYSQSRATGQGRKKYRQYRARQNRTRDQSGKNQRGDSRSGPDQNKYKTRKERCGAGRIERQGSVRFNLKEEDPPSPLFPSCCTYSMGPAKTGKFW